MFLYFSNFQERQIQKGFQISKTDGGGKDIFAMAAMGLSKQMSHSSRTSSMRSKGKLLLHIIKDFLSSDLVTNKFANVTLSLTKSNRYVLILYISSCFEWKRQIQRIGSESNQTRK